jgi:hypothetical protein
MKKRAILVVTGLFALNFAQGQELFKVLANKGSNQIKSGSVWQAVKTGDKLKKEDELKVSENSYVALVHTNGKPIELREAKTYKIADLASKVSAGSSVLNKYTDFILSSNSAEAKKNRMSATGQVSRGDVVGLKEIRVFLPFDKQPREVFNNKIDVNWEVASGDAPYLVTVKNMFDEELLRLETMEGKAKIDRSTPKLANESTLLIEVRSKTDRSKVSKTYTITKLSDARQESIKKSFGEMGSEASQETALNKFIMAGFYEENRLLIDAIAAYEEAIKLAPDVPTYKEAYEEFLYRNGLKEFKK